MTARSFTDQCLITPGDLRTAEGRPYTVFTPFKKSLYKALQERTPITPLPPPRKQPSMPPGIRPSAVPDHLDGFASTVPADLWPAGEREALKRLNSFSAKGLRDYKERRDFPATDGTSTLSPYLAVGSLTHRQCIAAALDANHNRFDSGNPGAVAWISEVAWREFYRHILVAFPRVSMHRAFKPATERIRWSDNDSHFQAWCDGRTGVPIVDASMRQLRSTGWMHNRVRMITAMYLTKDLFIDWRRGEQHFMRHLIDGDLASNNGGWQWSASTGTDAAPYFRIFNPITQSRRFDPDGEYIRRYVPELRDLVGAAGKGPIHDPSDLPPLARAQLDNPTPIIDRAKVKARVLEAFGAIAPK
jgi:deoxyribodipyrimidine photo-lyase